MKQRLRRLRWHFHELLAMLFFFAFTALVILGGVLVDAWYFLAQLTGADYDEPEAP